MQATAVTLSQTQDGLERLIGGDTLQQLNNNVTALTDAATTIGTLLGTAITEVAAVQVACLLLAACVAAFSSLLLDFSFSGCSLFNARNVKRSRFLSHLVPEYRK